MNRMRRFRREFEGEGLALEVGEPGRPRAFRTIDELMQGALQMFTARANAEDARELLARGGGPAEKRKVADARRAIALCERWTDFWHRSFNLTGDGIGLCRRCRRHRLDRLEKEILTAVILQKLGLLDHRSSECAGILRVLRVPGSRLVEALRRMSENGRLYRAKLIFYADDDRDLPGRELLADPALLEEVMLKDGLSRRGLKVKTEKELYRKLSDLTLVLGRKVFEMTHFGRHISRRDDLYKVCQKADRLLGLFRETIEMHRGWRLGKLLDEKAILVSRDEYLVVFLALLGKELGHLEPENELFTGGGLARAASDSMAEVRRKLGLLGPEGPLVRGDIVQPCGGEDLMLTGDPAVIERTEFELSDKVVEFLRIDRSKAVSRNDPAGAREPKVSLNELVLPDKVKKALSLAVAQVRHAGVLVKEWGLGKVIPYGRAVTLLFSGPPGVGKTACAEALAHELGRPILVADYAQIQNCLVGMTEKNIVRAFRQAARSGALLFWDEADAMFYNRDLSFRSWEVRDVNVLLQELENFEGVCVLATNRKVALDPALDRRITIKVEFEMPDRRMRLEIWRKLLPRRLPLGREVDLEQLAQVELTGGQIKNVVLNAARSALARDPRGRVEMEDFLEAIEMELGGVSVKSRRVGFV